MKNIIVYNSDRIGLITLSFDNKNDELYSLFFEDSFKKLDVKEKVKSLQDMYKKCCDLNIEGGVFFRIVEVMGVDYQQDLIKALDELGFGWFNDEERMQGVGTAVKDYDFADYFCDMKEIVKGWRGDYCNE